MAELWPFNWFQNGGRRHLEFTSGVYFLSFGRLWIVAGDIPVKFLMCRPTWIYGWLKFCQKYKMAAAAILSCYLVTLDHPRSLLHGQKFVLKFHVNRFITFRDMDIWKFCKFGLKRLFFSSQICFWGFWPQTLFFVIETPKGESASFKVYIVKIRPSVVAVGDDKKKSKGKGRKGKVHKVTSRLYFSIMGSRPRWTDFNKNWHGCRGPWRNYSVQFWSQYFQGSQIYRESKFLFSDWLRWSPLQQCWRYCVACDIVFGYHVTKSVVWVWKGINLPRYDDK